MYLCVGWYLPSQESEGSCIYVLGGIDQARKVRGHVFVCWGYRPSQESEGSCIYVLGGIDQARKVRGHVFMCWVVSTKPGK